MSSKGGKRKMGGEAKRNEKSGGGGRDKGSEREKSRAGSGRDSRQGGDGGSADRPSVFSRLGTKMGGVGGGGSVAPGGAAARSGSAGTWPRGAAGGPSPPKRKDIDGKKSGDLEKWDETQLDQEDQSTLEKKREMLQRELAKEMKDIQEGGGKKRPRSSSTSSTSSSSSTDSSSSDSSSSSSSDSSANKKKSKKKKRDSSSESDVKPKKKKGKNNKKTKKNEGRKKRPAGAALAKIKKEKAGKDRDNREPSPKKREERVEVKKEAEKPKINIVRAGGQERDKFGFYIAPQALQPVKEKEKSVERKRSDRSLTPDRRERRRSHSGGRRKEDRRRADSVRRGGSRDRRTRDQSASRGDRRSPARSTRSPGRGRSPLGRQRSPGRGVREKSQVRVNRSPGRGDRKGGSRANSRERERRDGQRDRSREKGSGKDCKKDEKDDLRGGRDFDSRRDGAGRRDEERPGVDRRREDRGSNGPSERGGRNDERGRGRREDERREDRGGRFDDQDDDRRGGQGRRDDRNTDRREDRGTEKKREDDKGVRGRDRDWEESDRGGRGRGGLRGGRTDEERSNEGRVEGRGGSGGGGRFDRNRRGEWGDERQGNRFEEKEEERRKRDGEDLDTRRGVTGGWTSRNDDSPRRGRGGRGRRGRGDRRGDSLGRQSNLGEGGAGDGWRKTSGRGAGLGRGGRRGDENRSRSRGRGGSLDKSGGSVELKLDTSMELLKSPRMPTCELKDVDVDVKSPSAHDTTNESREDNLNTISGKEEAEDLAEDFSDFGDSDDEILNQEETDSREGGELRDGDSRPPSRLSQKERKRREGRDGVLSDIETEDTNTASANESEETIKSNAKLADALGADWSQLIPKEKPNQVETGDAKKRWSVAEIVRRVGLSKKFLGEDGFKRTLDQINSNLPDSEAVVLLDPVAGLHCAKRARLAEQETILTDLGGCRALSARADINIRRKLNGLRSADTGLPPPRINTNMDLFNKAKEMLAAKVQERELVKEKVATMLANQKPLIC